MTHPDMTMIDTPISCSLVRTLRSIVVASWAAGCGGDHKTIDAMPDTAPVTLECSTYCDKIQANCTGANKQYLGAEQCLATCASFTVGTSTVTDASGNTLGCRINYAVAAATMPATHCPHAGPVGDLITPASPSGFCSGTDVCTSFCTLEIKACGSGDVPLPGDPLDATNNHLYQYANMDDCMKSCAGTPGSTGYDKTHAYTTTSTGESLACRLLQATSAAISVTSAKTYCAYTAEFTRGPCVGTPSP